MDAMQTKTKVVFVYKAGFRRLWLALSLIWAIAILTIVVRDSDIAPIDGMWLVLIPCGGLYLLGVCLVWIIEGFAKADR